MVIRSAFGRLPPATQGAILLVTGISIFGLTDNFTMLVSDQVGVGQFHFSRSIFSIIMVYIMARLFGMSVMPKRWGFVLVRTMFVALSMLLALFFCYSDDANRRSWRRTFYLPIFVLVFSALFFKERLASDVSWRW